MHLFCIIVKLKELSVLLNYLNFFMRESLYRVKRERQVNLVLMDLQGRMALMWVTHLQFKNSIHNE